MTLNIKTLSIMTLSIMIFSKMLKSAIKPIFTQNVIVLNVVPPFYMLHRVYFTSKSFVPEVKNVVAVSRI